MCARTDVHTYISFMPHALCLPPLLTSHYLLLSTRNGALEAVVASTPPERREDLVFLQNGMLGEQ